MYKLILSTLIFYLLMSCEDTGSIRRDKDILNGWDIGEEIKFVINDTIDYTSNIYFYVRNNNDYPFSNIFLIASLKSNQKIYEVDTLEYLMADTKGQWLGKGFSDIKESKLLWKKSWKPLFPPPYTIEIRQANRKIGQINGDKYLLGILSLGLSIEKISNE